MYLLIACLSEMLLLMFRFSTLKRGGCRKTMHFLKTYLHMQINDLFLHVGYGRDSDPLEAAIRTFEMAFTNSIWL